MAKKTKVVNRRRNSFDDYIGRGTVWGNPFKIGDKDLTSAKSMTRNDVIVLYLARIMASPHLLARLDELQGKTLGCWCKPQSCHGDVLAGLVDSSNNLFSVGFSPNNPPSLFIMENTLYEFDNPESALWYITIDEHEWQGKKFSSISCANNDIRQGIVDVLNWMRVQHLAIHHG